MISEHWSGIRKANQAKVRKSQKYIRMGKSGSMSKRFRWMKKLDAGTLDMKLSTSGRSKIVTPQCYGCIDHVHSMSIIIHSKHPWSSSILSHVILCKNYDLNCLNRLLMLMFEWTMLVFVLNALVISLSMLNLALGTMFMLATFPKYAFKSYLWK